MFKQITFLAVLGLLLAQLTSSSGLDYGGHFKHLVSAAPSGSLEIFISLQTYLVPFVPAALLGLALFFISQTILVAPRVLAYSWQQSLILLRSLITLYGPLFLWCLVDWYTPNCPRCFKMYRLRRPRFHTKGQRCGFSKMQLLVLATPGRSALAAAQGVMWPVLGVVIPQMFILLARWFLRWYHTSAVHLPGTGLPCPEKTTSVVGLLVTPSGMLLASRGPATKPEEIIGMLAGVGGKVDPDEGMEDALIREFKEEVSVDISKMQCIPLGVNNYGGNRCMHFIIYSDSDVRPAVPAAERAKVVEPGFYPLNVLPYHDMIPELATLIKDNSDLLSLSVRLSGATAPPTEWVKRRLDTIPADFSMFMVNNKDSSCLLYSLNPQLPVKLDMVKLEANMPEAGYSPIDVLTPAQLRETAIWDCDLGFWTHGDPNHATIFLSYVRNGDFGHYDMLKRLGPDETVRDYIIYPNGRGAFKQGRGGVDDGIEDASDGASVVASEVASSVDESIASDSNKTFSLHESHLNDDNTFNLRGFTAVAKYMRAKLPGQTQTDRHMHAGQAAILPAVEQSYWGAAYVAVQGVAQRLNDFITFNDRSSVFTDLTYADGLQPSTATAKTGRVVAMLNNNTVGNAVHICKNVYAMTAQMDVSVRVGQGASTLMHWFDLTARPYPPVATLVDNMVPTQAPEKFIDLSRNIAGLFNASLSTNPPVNTTAANIANDISRAIWSIDDRTGGDLTYIYERLIAGMVTASFGARPHGIARGLTFLRMFPNTTSWAFIWGTRVPVNGIDPNGCTPFKTDTGMSSITLLPVATYQSVGNPTITTHRDYRVPLHMISQAYLGFAPNTAYGPNNAQRTNYYAANASYADEIPYITFLLPRTDTPAVRAPGDYTTCATNPDSWKDAICFLLKNFGRSSDFAAAMDQNTATFVRHMSPTQTMLPIPLSERFQSGPRLTACLQARLLTMRALIPTFDAGDGDAIKDWKKSMLALKPTGQSLVDQSAQSLARIRLIYTQQTELVMFPPVAAAQVAGSSIDIDTEWYQLLHGVDLGETNEFAMDSLDQITAGMTTQELNNLRVWLADDTFAGRWLNIDAAARPVLREGWELSVPVADRTTLEADRARLPEEMGRALVDGYNMRRDHSLCTFDIQRTRLVTTPCGVKALRALCHGMDLYHSDTMALNINDTLRSLSVDGILKRMLLASTVWRACSDTASEELGLTGSKLSLALGSFETGNVALDLALDNVDGHSKAGGMAKILELYLGRLSTSLAVCGYDLGTLLTAHGAMVEWVNFDKFRYLNGVATDMVSLKFIATHHLMSKALSPQLSRIGGLIQRKVEWMANQVNGDLVPWDSWVSSSSAFQPTELLGALRIAVASIGFCLKAPATVFYKRRTTEAMPTEYKLLQQFDSIAPRRSDCTPVTPYYAIDPYSCYSPVLGYSISPITVDDTATFLTPTWQYGYLSLSRTSERAPTISYNLSNYSHMALPNATGRPKFGYNNNALFGESAEVYAGAASSPNHEMTTDIGESSLDWIKYQPQAGLMMSGNQNVSKNLIPMSHSLGINTILGAPITQSDGAAIPFDQGKRSMTPFGSITTGLWVSPSPAAISDYERFAALHPGVVRRAEVWATKITIVQLPANHAPLTDVVPVTSEQVMPWLNEVAQIQYDRGLAAGVFELPGVLPNTDPSPKPVEMNVEGLVNIPDPYDARHMLEGFRASKRLLGSGELAAGRQATTDVQKLTKEVRKAELDLKTSKLKLEKALKKSKAVTPSKGKKAVLPGDSISQAGSGHSNRISVSESTLKGLVDAAVAARLAEGSGDTGPAAKGKRAPLKARFH